MNLIIPRYRITNSFSAGGSFLRWHLRTMKSYLVNRIPVRNAATLAYISQLLLQSLEPLRCEAYRAQGDSGPGQIFLSARRVHAEANFQLQEQYEEFYGEQDEEEEEEEREEQTEEDTTNDDRSAEQSAEVQT